jgi:hypothetical protein
MCTKKKKELNDDLKKMKRNQNKDKINSLANAKM